MTDVKHALLDALAGAMPPRPPAPAAETVHPDVTLTACGCANLRDSIRAAIEGRAPALCAEHDQPAAPVALNDDAALAALALGTPKES